MMGSRVGDVLASRKPYVGGQLARHPASASASAYSDHQGVVEEGRGRATSSSKVSKIAGMFQGGGGGGAGVASSTRGAPEDETAPPGSSSSHDGPHHATVVRTESHLARFNNARALFEKMGQGEATAPGQPRLVAAKASLSSRGEPKSSDGKTEAKIPKFETKVDTSKTETKKITGPSTRTPLTSHHLRRPPGGGGGSSSSDERGGRAESISPARSIGGTSSSSSRSASPSPARTTNGHAHHSDQETGGVGAGSAGAATAGIGVLGLRRPGSASSRSLSTSSTESEPPRRWPPGKVSSSSSTSSKTSASSTAAVDSNVTSKVTSFKGDSGKSDSAAAISDLRKLKPEKPAKPEGLERRISAHEQHQELIARHKNWFQTFSKNRSPASSPVKPDSRPESPNKAEGRPPSPCKAEEVKTVLSSKSEWRSTQPSKSEQRHARSYGGSYEKEAEDEVRREKDDSFEEECKDERPNKVDEQEAWSSVLQSRYGPKAKDILSPRGRAEGETASDWRKERAAILSSRTGQRHSSSEDETSTGPVKGHYRVTEVSSRFEDTATLQSSWSPPPNYNVTETSQSTVVKTLKEEINIAETERTKSARQQQQQQQQQQQHQAVRENGNAHESAVVGVGGTVENEDENVVSLVERKEKADLIVSESVVIKDSTKEKDIEKRHYESSAFTKTDSSSTTTLSSTTSVSYTSTTTAAAPTTTSSSSSSTSSPSSATVSSSSSPAAAVKRGEEHNLLRPLKKQGSSKETSEEVNLKLKESIAGGYSTEEISSSTSYSERRDYRQELEERRAKRLEEDRLSSREEVIETRIKENVTTERRKEEITDRRRRDEIADGRRKRDDSSDGWRDEVSDHRRRRGGERREDGEVGVRGRDRSEENRVELTHREKSEERIRQIRKNREARSRERREESLEKTDYKSLTETETRSSSHLHHDPVAQSVSSLSSSQETKTTSSTVTHYRTETHTSSYEPKSYVTHAKIPTSGAATDPTPPPTLHVETEKTAEVEGTTPTVKALEGGGEVVETVVIGGVLSALKAETVYVSSTEDLSQNDDSKRESRLDIYKVDLSEGESKEKTDDGKEKEEAKEDEEDSEKDVEKVGEGEPQDPSVRRQLFPDVVAECQLAKGTSEAQEPEVDSERLLKEGSESETTEKEEEDWRHRISDPIETKDLVERISPPPSPCAQSLAALDALIHGTASGTGSLEHTPYSSLEKPEGEEEEEIVYDHTVTSAQHKIQFCTTPVTVEGIAPESESHDTDPEPLPPPIPPHAVDPEIMTADEAERLLSAKESQSILSDEEAQEVVLLLSPPNEDSSKILPPPPPPIPPHHGEGLSSVPPHYDIPPAVPPHYADITPPIPPHFAPNEDEFDTRVASHFDATLASPLSPEDEPSEADSSEETGDICQVSRVKEVLVEDGVHYLEDGHFWVEVPGLPEDDDEEDMDPTLPFHPHTKLSFSKEPIQVFSTYSVTEYDRKNDEVDPVAASAEYELEKRVEKMDLFPVEIIKGEGGLGLSIIGMGVGADAGVEKLGIFVKTITAGGATERDGRIQVNDQIIEVDGKSLVGVTQVFAASVLKNTSGRVHFLIGREKDPENSEVALLIKQSLQADREREERRRALGGPDYDPHTGNGLFDPMSSPSEENSRSEEVPQNYSSYLEGGSSPTSPDAVSPPIESFDLEGDTSDTSPDNDAAILKLRLKEVQYKNAVAEAEINKLKMTLLEMEKIVTENVQYSSQLNEAQVKVVELDEKLQSKLSEVSTYQDMLEQSQGQYIILEKKYYKAKKIIKEYQGRERDFLHREEYHITQLEEKDSHYNALVKALKDRVINLEEELKNAQKKAGLPVEVPSDLTVQPAYLDLQQSAQSALAKPPRKPSLCTFDPEISDTETSDNGASEGDKANTVERKLPVKEELDEAVPPHELLDVSASRAKGELAARGGLANRHLPSLKKTTSMSSAGSQDHSLDDSSLDDDLPEAQKHAAAGETSQDTQMDQGSRRSAEPQEISFPQSPVHQPQSPLQPAISSPQIPQNSSFNSSSNQAKSTQPPSYSQATMGNISYLGSPPPPYQPPPTQFGIPRQPLAPSDPSTGLPPRSLSGAVDTHVFESRSESRPEIPYRHPPPVARVLPVNRAEISESASLAAHLANRTPQQLSLAEQLKALLAEREVQGEVSQKNEREASPSKRSPTSLMEDVRQAVLQADVSCKPFKSSVPTPHYKPYMGKKPVISAPINLSSTAHVVATGQIVQQVNSPNRSQQSAVYSIGGRDSIRDSNTGSQSPKLGRSSIHASPLSGVSPNPSGVVLLSQRPIDSSLPIQKLVPGVDGSSGDISSGPASLGSGDEGSGASLGSQTSLSHTHMPADRSKRAHMWQTAPVIDWTKEQVSQWLVVQGLESCVSRFQEIGMTGPRLLNLDIRDLKSLGLPPDEKSKLKRKVKELRLAVEKERKQAEKEKKERERLQKKAEKLAEKAEKKKK
ncbi:uncharacterized protein [Macrobrachium rosenbergii]|uniref:uncharacterized protein isoform X23 n=1 Tax=Macrobrachium rosenbergii TaxID=79674 RepID=UPI0034D39D15